MATQTETSKIAKEFDTLYDTGIDNAPYGWVRIMSIEEDENNMRKLCKMIESFDKSDEVFERLTSLFDFSIVEVIDAAFHLLNKFPNNPYLQAQCVCLIRYMAYDNEVPFPQGNKQKYIGTIVEAIHRKYVYHY